MKSMSKMRKNEQGMVSILVTMIMIIVITLIVLGFSQVTRRNQQEALDNQLNTQAYYAAESGVNEAVNYLTLPANSGANINTVGNCTSFMKAPYDTGASGTSVLDGNTKTQYTCLMVNTQPPTLTVAPLTQGNNQILYLANADNQQFTQLKYSWTKEAGSNFAGSGCNATGANGETLPQYGSWDCPYGLLRLDLVDATNISNNVLDNNQGTTSLYLIPSYSTGSNSVSIAWPPKAQPVDPATSAPYCSSGNSDCPVRIIPVKCSSNGGCSLQLNFTGGGGSKQYFARLTTMYQDASNVTIAGGDSSHAINAVTGIGASFVGGQALIDSTGQSEDELRRVQVRIPLTTSTNVSPAYGLQTTQTICKQIQDGPGDYSSSCP